MANAQDFPSPNYDNIPSKPKKIRPEKDSLEYEIYRASTIKDLKDGGFQMNILEQSGKLLKKCLKPYFHSSKEVDNLAFKAIFKQAGNHGLLKIKK